MWDIPEISGALPKAVDPLTSRRATIAIAILLPVIFGVDLFTPIGWADWTLYAIPLVLTLWVRNRRAPLYVTAVMTALLMIHAWLPFNGMGLAGLLVNRGSGAAVGWLLAWFLMRYRTASEALATANERLASIVDMEEDGIVSIDVQRRIVFFNKGAERLFGYTAQEIMGRPIEVLMPARYAESHPAHVRQFAVSDESTRPARTRMEVIGLRRDGREFPVEATIGKVTIANRLLMTAIVRDITDRKRTEDELRRLNTDLERRVDERTRDVEGTNRVLRQEILQHQRARGELEASQAQLRTLAAHMESVREEEATRIAREVHDVLGQMLTSIKLDVSWLQRHVEAEGSVRRQRYEKLRGQIDNVNDTVRKIATQLRPGVLDDLGLPAAVEWQARDFARRANLDLDLLVEQGLTVESSIATPVFRILQEMLTNVAEHAGATSICVRLGRRDGGLLMEVQDNGRGITKADMVRPTSLGLLGMRERALALGGELFITTEPGPGTRVSAVIPLRADSQRATQK